MQKEQLEWGCDCPYWVKAVLGAFLSYVRSAPTNRHGSESAMSEKCQNLRVGFNCRPGCARLPAAGDMMMIRSLVIVTALCLCGTSASALTMQECRAKYKAAQATRTFDTWAGFQEKKCGIHAKATASTLPPAAPKPQPVQRQ
jgi:hypothetical protein